MKHTASIVSVASALAAQFQPSAGLRRPRRCDAPPAGSFWAGDGSSSVETRQSRRRDKRVKCKAVKRRALLGGRVVRFRGTMAQLSA